MSWVQETLEKFGEQIGLTSLGLGPDGVAQLELQAGGVLAVEPVQGGAEVLVYLGRPLGFDAGAVLRNALTRAHFSSAQALPVQVAVRGEGPEGLLLALVRIPDREFTVQMLGRVVECLGRWCDGARNG